MENDQSADQPTASIVKCGVKDAARQGAGVNCRIRTRPRALCSDCSSKAQIMWTHSGTMLLPPCDPNAKNRDGTAIDETNPMQASI
jgi:hypothetical protein